MVSNAAVPGRVETMRDLLLERGPRGASTTERDHEGLAGGFTLSVIPLFSEGADEYNSLVLIRAVLVHEDKVLYCFSGP